MDQLADGKPASVEEVNVAIGQALGAVLGYLDEQMTAGRLRRVHPVLAFHLLAGPIVTHLLTRPLADRGGRFTISPEEAVDQFVDAWLRAMAPGKPSR